MDEAVAQKLAEKHAARIAEFALKRENFLEWFYDFFSWGTVFRIIGMAITVLIIFVLYKIITHTIKRLPQVKASLQRTMMVKRALRYCFQIIVVMYILSCMGIKLTAVMGAAGIFGLALGFAAQTTASNLISGLFVISEGSLHIGDFIDVGGVMGTVDSIDLLSTRIHTLDNLMVRIPNATIIDTNLQNNSYFPMRRLQFNVCVKYGTDIAYAIETYLKAPPMCPTVLTDPAPIVWVDGFGDSNIDMTIAVYCRGCDIIATKNAMYIAIQKVMAENGLDMSYNTMELVEHDDTPIKVSISAKLKRVEKNA